jgi:DNA-binding response OmpR family regulator
VSASITLNGCTVLVLEDDFLLAEEMRESLEDAGAVVLGPCPSNGAALRFINQTPPDIAVLDVNLGTGPTFEIPKLLKANGIPFAFATGYDASVIPPEFASAIRLEKPVEPNSLIKVLRELRASVVGLIPGR